MDATRQRRHLVIVRNRRRKPVRINAYAIKGIHFASAAEGRELFDHQARRLLTISGQEFLERWDAGEYRDMIDPDLARRVNRLAMLMPFVGRSGG